MEFARPLFGAHGCPGKIPVASDAVALPATIFFGFGDDPTTKLFSRRHATRRAKPWLIDSQMGPISFQAMHTSVKARDPRVPSPLDRRRLSVATLGISDAAITRAYREPGSVRESTLLRLRLAAVELQLPLPGDHLEEEK